MFGMLRRGHGLRDIIQGIVEVVMSRSRVLICMNSDLIVKHIERHSVEELSEKVMAIFTSFCAALPADVS